GSRRLEEPSAFFVPACRFAPRAARSPRGRGAGSRTRARGIALAPLSDMGVEKPYEVETGALRDPPRPRERIPVEARVRDLIRPTEDGVVIAGIELVASSGDPERSARELRSLLTHRLEERRPNADSATWARFV